MKVSALRGTKNLATMTYTAGGDFTLDFNALPEKGPNGLIPHLEAIIFECPVNPTFGMGNELSTVGVNNAVAQLTIHDGHMTRFQGASGGGFNLLRLCEKVWGSAGPDADTDTASGTVRYFRRIWRPGPPHLAGSPGDFLIPCKYLKEGGSISGMYGTLAQMGIGASGNPSAVTASIRPVAVISYLDHWRLPPLHEVKTIPMTGTRAEIKGGRMLDFLALLNSTSYDAFTAADIDNLGLELGAGNVYENFVATEALTALYQSDMRIGDGLVASAFVGDEPGASSDNTKIVNRATPTAVAAAAANIQMVAWSQREGRLTKLWKTVDQTLAVEHNGSQTSGTIVALSSFLPRTEAILAAQITRCGLDANRYEGEIKTLSKNPFNPKNPAAPFMPVMLRQKAA